MTNKHHPSIRFEGYVDAWEQRKFDDIVDVRSGRDYKHLNEGDIPVYGTGGYMLSVDEALSYDEDAIGIGRKGTINKPYLLRAPFWTVDTLFYSVPMEGNNLFFVNNLFQRINWKKYDESTGVPSLSKAVINKVTVRVPVIEEQTKIGSFFKQLDETITLQERELELLKEQKKGFLQKLFPKDMKSSPDVRFEHFEDMWEQRKLGESVKFINGRAYKQNELLRNGKYRVLRVGNFNTNDFWYYSNLELEKNKYADKGDLLYLWATNFGPEIWHEEQVIYHYHIWKLEIEDSNLDKQYLYTWLITDKEKIKLTTNGTTMVHVTKSGMEERNFQFPKVIEEQIKIGKFFKQLDETITFQEKELEKLKQLKKAFLQKMFI